MQNHLRQLQRMVSFTNLHPLMKQIPATLCLFLFFHIAACAQAQPDSQMEAKPQFKLSVNYNSNLNYYGRTDSLKSAGFFPLAELWMTPKFYVNVAPVFVHNSQQAFDYAGTVTTLGYQKITSKWLSNLYVLKPFYKSNATLVQSALKAQGGASFTRLNNLLNLTFGADVKWSNQWDLGATAGLDHIFRFEKNNAVIVLDPSVNAYAGSQQFSKTYTVKKKGGLLRPPTQQQVTETSSAFNILAYEASMPLIYTQGNWQVLVTPSYIMPKHLLQVSGRPDLSEQGQNMVYTTITLKHTF